MTQQRLKLYTIDPEYLRFLASVDANVACVQQEHNKEPVPYAGIISVYGEHEYCVPLMSPRPKHEGMNNGTDFTKIIIDGQLYGVMNFNNMIPVPPSVLTPLDLQATPADTAEGLRYKKLLAKEQNFCQQNRDKIVRKAASLRKIISFGQADKSLSSRCCDFSKLEDALARWLS